MEVFIFLWIIILILYFIFKASRELTQQQIKERDAPIKIAENLEKLAHNQQNSNFSSRLEDLEKRIEIIEKSILDKPK